MKKLYESKNFFEAKSLEEILEQIPEHLDRSKLMVAPVYLTDGYKDLNVMIGFKFVIYGE